MAERIGFVGVGRMGANMARRLKESGYTIGAVYDMNTGAAQALAQELGTTAAQKLQEITKASDVIITVVTDDKAMKGIYNGGLLSRSKGKVFINCATVTPDIHVWVEGKAEAAGANSLEACMASSITQARQGTLELMCGGKQEVFDRVKPILEKLGENPRYIGPAGKSGPGQSAGEHGNEHQHSGAGRGARASAVAGSRSGDGPRSVLTDGC